jgi:ABC-type lipoprotein export system ATPase subunit
VSTPPTLVDALVEVRGIDKTYRRGPETVHALRDVTFEMRAGEVVALVGPSGSGKTTLLNLLAGWEMPEAGELRWRGEALDARSMSWSDVAIVPQDIALLEELPNGENVRLPLRLGRAETDEGERRIESLVERLGVRSLLDRMPGEVSLGEQQRIAIARALAVEPTLLIADEPTAHQDEASTALVLGALRDAAEAGTACLVATHSEEVIGSVDRVLPIRDGRVRDGRVGDGLRDRLTRPFESP